MVLRHRWVFCVQFISWYDHYDTPLLVLPTSYISHKFTCRIASLCVLQRDPPISSGDDICIRRDNNYISHYVTVHTHTLCSGVVWSGFIWEYSYQHQPALYITIVPVKGNVTLSLQTVPGTTEPLFREPLQNGYCKTRRLCKIRGCRNLTAEELALNAALIKLVLHQDAVRF